MYDLLQRDPAVHPFVECPNCRELLEVNASLCSRCREEIDPEYAAVSAIIVHHNTQAVSVANTITTFDAFIPVALIGTVSIYVISWYSSHQPRIPTGLLFWPALPLVAIALWYRRFGRFGIGDEEYVRARREMRRSFAFWLVFLIVDVLLVIVT